MINNGDLEINSVIDNKKRNSWNLKLAVAKWRDLGNGFFVEGQFQLRFI